MTKTTKIKPFYVSNILLYGEYVKWYAAIEIAKKEGKEEPQIPPYIVDAMTKITKRLTYNSKFINYSFKEEMIGDALYDCIKYAKKFNLTRSVTPNPFSYITTIAFNAFLRRIDTEKKQSYVKSKLIADTPIHEFFDNIDSDDIEMQKAFTEFIQDNSDNLQNNIPQALKKKAKKLQEALELEAKIIKEEIGLERFIDE